MSVAEFIDKFVAACENAPRIDLVGDTYSRIGFPADFAALLRVADVESDGMIDLCRFHDRLISSWQCDYDNRVNPRDYTQVAACARCAAREALATGTDATEIFLDLVGYGDELELP